MKDGVRGIISIQRNGIGSFMSINSPFQLFLVGSGGRGQIRGLPSAKMIALLKVDEIY